MGFQDLPKVVLKAASSKGGKVRHTRSPKGLAALPPEKRRKIASMGGKTSAKNRGSNNGAEQSQAGGGEDRQQLADILGDLDE